MLAGVVRFPPSDALYHVAKVFGYADSEEARDSARKWLSDQQRKLPGDHPARHMKLSGRGDP